MNKINKVLKNVYEAKPKEITDEQKAQFSQMSNELSPENLYCDGEISKSQAKAKYNAIMKRWKALEKVVGRTVDEYEFE